MNDLKVVVRGVEDTFLITGIVLKETECLRGSQEPEEYSRESKFPD